MSRRILIVVLLGIAVAVVLIWAFLSHPVREPGRGPRPRSVATPTPAPEQRVVLLYPGPDDMLHPEIVPLALPDELETRVRVLVERLLQPSPAGRPPVSPYPARLVTVFVREGRIAYVDFTEPEQSLTGSSSEVPFTYAVVNTVLLNCPDLRAVQLLFGDREVETLSGHLDLSRPLVLNKRLIAAS